MKIVELSEEQRIEVQKLELRILKEINKICNKYSIKYMAGYGTLIGAVRHNGFIPWDDDMDLCMLRKEYVRFRKACINEFGEDFFYQTNETDPEYFMLYDKIRINGTIFKETFVDKYNINHGVYIDIFAIDSVPENLLKRNIQYYGFHFCRTGVMAKYMDLNARKGKKKVLFSILRILYLPFNIKFLYDKTQKIASQYSDSESIYSTNFYSPYHKLDTFKTSLYTNTTELPFEDTIISVPIDYNTMLTTLYGDYMQFPPPEKRNTRHELTEIRLSN